MQLIERFLNLKPEFTFFVQALSRDQHYLRAFWSDEDFIPPGTNKPFGWIAGIGTTEFVSYLTNHGVDPRFFCLLQKWFPMVLIRNDEIMTNGLIDRLEKKLFEVPKELMEVYCNQVEEYCQIAVRKYLGPTDSSNGEMNILPFKGTVGSFLAHPLINPDKLKRISELAGTKVLYCAATNKISALVDADHSFYIEFTPEEHEFYVATHRNWNQTIFDSEMIVKTLKAVNMAYHEVNNEQ
ncbi:hypothetical protein CENTIMANUS_00330 [Klebsiella phage vB_KpM_Centimanus]